MLKKFIDTIKGRSSSKSQSTRKKGRKRNDGKKSDIQLSDTVLVDENKRHSVNAETQTEPSSKEPFGYKSSLPTLLTLSSGIGGSQDQLGTPYGSNVSINHHHHHNTFKYITYASHTNFTTQTSFTENTNYVDNSYHDNSFLDASHTNIHNINDSQNIQIGDGNVMFPIPPGDSRDYREGNWRYYPNQGMSGGYYSDDDDGGYVVDDMDIPICSSSPKASARHKREAGRSMDSNNMNGCDDFGTRRFVDNKMYGLNPSLRELKVKSDPTPAKKNSNLERAFSLDAIWTPSTNEQCGIGARPKDSLASRPADRSIRERKDESSFVIPRPKVKTHCSNASLAESLKAYADGSTNDINKIASIEAINSQNVHQRNEVSWVDEVIERHRREQFKKKAEFMSSPDVSGGSGWNSARAFGDKKKATSTKTLYKINEWETAV